MKPETHSWKHWFLMAALPAALLAPAHCAYGSIKGPYTPDANTAILLHLDEAAGAGVAANAVSGAAGFVATANPGAASPRNPTPGILGAPGASGAGFNFGNAANLSASNSMGLFMDGNQNGVADLDTSGAATGDDLVPMADLCGPSGEFTFEALVRLPSLTGANREIIAMDTSGSPRPFQFRFTSTGQIEFNNIGTSGANPKATIPTTGPEAFVANEWFHVALTYDGVETLNVYWTKLDNTRTGATLLQSFSGTPALNETGSAVLVVGNENRNTSGEGLLGQIDEVRISRVARGATDMIFDTEAPRIAPTINPQPGDQFLGVGEVLEIQSHASGSPTLQYQWQKSDGAAFSNLSGQTNDALSLPVELSTQGDYRFLVSNAYGSATSGVAQVTVGAIFSGLYRTGFDDNNAPVADGLADPHYALLLSASPDALGPIAIVPPMTDTAYNANDPGSKWIDPFAAVGGVQGVYTYRTTFLLDSASPRGATLSASILAAGPTTIRLNDQPTGIANLAPAFPGPFRNLFSFTITNGFVAGLNSLDFEVDNGTNAVNVIYGNALRVTSIRGVGLALSLPLAIAEDPRSQKVREGGNVTFSAQATGSPPLSYQWYADGQALNGATNRVLRFPSVTTGAQGAQFKAVVSNDSGSLTSQVATLTLTPSNQPVVAKDLAVSGLQGAPITIPMSMIVQNASDPDGDPITIESFDPTGANKVSSATIEPVGAALVYSNSASFMGTDSFNVVLTDGQGGSATSRVKVEVTEEVTAYALKAAKGPANTVRLSWPAAATSQGFQLFSADAITGPFTNAVSETVATEGTESAVNVTPAGAGRFYRLGKP